jgi:hypothetical protein
MTVAINPQTKLGSILETHPEIGEALVGWAPGFGKLKNPVIRQTVVKGSTVEEAARLGGISIRDLVEKLREATGQGAMSVIEEAKALALEGGGKPAWLDRSKIRKTIDADAMLQTGVHPLGTVKESVVAVETGEIVELTAGFRPEPLIEAMRNAGLAVYSEQTEPGRHSTYFCRTADDPALAEHLGSHSCGSGGCG